jgi:signal transduction histidine kinase
MDRLAHVGAVLTAVAAGQAISATVATGVWVVEDLIEPAQAGVFWRTWWLSGLAGGVIAVPLVLAWTRPLAAAWRGRGAWEGALMIASVAGLSAIALSARRPLLYLVSPAFVWAALRFGPQGATAAVAVAAVAAVWFTGNETGLFVSHSVDDTNLDLQLYILFSTLTTQCLAAIVTERQRAALEALESRHRLVSASARERRKLERDLHDGAQQRLVAASINLSLADELANGNRDLRERVSAATSEVEEALAELREVAHGIYPPALARWGLARAFAPLAARYSGKVTVTETDPGRFPPEVEAALYYCCLESVQNAVKHAGRAARMTVRLYTDHGTLRLEVRDDGPGFEVTGAHDGVGLQNMRDRVGAVGGRVEISSHPAQGTLVTATAPLTSAADPTSSPDGQSPLAETTRAAPAG